MTPKIVYDATIGALSRRTGISIKTIRRHTVMNDFLDHTFRDLDVDPAFEAKFRSGMPELPDDPTDAQVDAWVELAELVSDPDFRASVRAMSEAAWGADGGREQMADQETNARMMAYADERVVPLMDAGTDPASPEAAALVDEIVASLGEPDRRELLARWEVGADARAERYWQLIGTINGWPPFPARMPAFEWLITALRATIGINRR